MKYILIFAALLLASRLAYAWGDMGHSVVGEVAEEMVAPNTKVFIRGIVGVEPLAVAATWPDHVRDDVRFGKKDHSAAANAADIHNFADYHFCEIPTGYDYNNKPNKEVKDCFGAISGAVQLLKDNSGGVLLAEKIIALRYLVHVVGDIHQPLHVGNSYDIGGNVCLIHWQPSAKAQAKQINLHAFWDDIMVEYLGETYADPSQHRKAATYYPDYVAGMKRHHPEMFTVDAKKEFSAGTLAQWLSESQQIRESGVYPDDPASMSGVQKGQEYMHRPYCKWFSDEDNDVLAPESPKTIDSAKMPTLGIDYANHFAPIVETQLLKAGLRLAKILDDIAESVSGPSGPQIRNRELTNGVLPNESEDSVLMAVQDAFRSARVSKQPAPANK